MGIVTGPWKRDDDAMLTFAKARRLAETWVAMMTDDSAEIMRDAVEAKPYGWIFVYQSKEYVRDPANYGAMLVGTAPFIIDRINGEIRTLGPGPLVEQNLSEYERSLPPAIFYARPEAPHW